MKTEEIDIPWRNNSAPQKVLGLLNDYENNSSRFVGGCVRNVLMGDGDFIDFDIATKFEPQKTTNILEQAGLKVIQSGASHGTVTALCENKSFEITTLRSDVETDGRHAKVNFTDDWVEDAQRRDFTCNALYFDGIQTVYDPTGQGINDARARKVKFIGDPNERLKEDYLRILRFFRLNAQFGIESDPEGLRACAKNREGLKRISKERIWKELRFLLRRSKRPFDSLKRMFESGVLSIVLPSADQDKLYSRPASLFDVWVNRQPDELQKLMAIIPRNEIAVKETIDGLRLANAYQKRLLAWARSELNVERIRTMEEWYRVVFRQSKETFFDVVGSSVSKEDVGDWEDLVDKIYKWRLPCFPIRGRDLVEIGFVDREIGEILRELEETWVQSDFQCTSKNLLDIARRRFKTMAI